MSHSETINYEALALQCNAICGIAQTGINKIDELLSKIKVTATKLQSSKIVQYEKYIISEKKKIEKQIEQLKEKAAEQAKLGTRRVSVEEYYKKRMDLIDSANSLQEYVDTLTVEKIEVLNDMINEEIKNVGNQADENIRNQAYGILDLGSLLDQINNIEDISLRECVYRKAVEGNCKDFNELVALGKESLEEKTERILEKRREAILEGIKKDMEAKKVESSIIEATLSKSSIEEIRTSATNEIIGEEVRKESLKIILKAIEQRGFIVDRKNNIKIDRKNNEVNVIGIKASGQTAEFKIYLDGRFIYKFDGFEGQACQKDIEPFMNDLEDIYGLKITGRTELWKNPDKLSSNKYQQMDTNKNKK